MQRIAINLGLILFIFSAKAQKIKTPVEEEFKIIKMPKYPMRPSQKRGAYLGR